MPAHRWRSKLAWLAALLLAVAAPAQAQDYPSKPVKIIVDSAPGSAIDVIVRIIADKLTQLLGQQVLIANQPGGGGAIAARMAAASAPDGHTLLVAALSAFVAPPGSASNLPIQVPRDFAAIGYFGGASMFVSASPALGVNTLAELIALAKARPGELAYGTNGPGRLTHLTGELLQNRAGIKLLMVPYSGGTAQVLNDIMGGRLQLAFDSYSGVAGALQAGTVKALAVTSPQRLPDFPDLPAAAETLPGFASSGWQVLLAPAGTPDAIVQKVNAKLNKTTGDPDTRRRLSQFGRDERALSPAETTAFIQSEQQTWAPILQQIGQAK